jgi:hypothetical protein
LLSEQQPSYFSSPITSEFPMTPELSPRQTSSRNNYNGKSPQHYLYPPISTIEPEDDNDDLDNEVATATSSLYLSTPSQHPYGNPKNDTYVARKTNSASKKRRTSTSTRALKTLQIEVAALCEEIDHIRRRKSIHKRRKSSLLHWKWLWLFKSVAKHAFFNFLILLLLFFVLWRRKSPIAYAVISHVGPRLRDLFQYLFSNVVFWKVTV